MPVKSAALASIKATYTDSEDEDGVSIIEKRPLISTTVTPSAHRLVSYHDETVILDDEDGTTSIVTMGQPLENGQPTTATNDQNSPSTHQEKLVSHEDMDEFGVVIPPAPVGACPQNLQVKINALYEKMESGGLDTNKVIQQRKDFRNPSIYEKLLQHCEIDEYGSNYPLERFDPCKWGKVSYYEELAKAQIVEMERLKRKRKERGTKMEIISGLAKRPSSSITTAEDAKKRKSKCDQVATGATATVTAAATTGTKATVITAFGSLPKKRL